MEEGCAACRIVKSLKNYKEVKINFKKKPLHILELLMISDPQQCNFTISNSTLILGVNCNF